MIQANELRIGNFIEKKEITYSGLKTLTHAIEIKDLAHYESFEPILITEEWLLKFGFVKEENNIDVCYQIEIKDGYFLEYFKSMTYTSLILREVNNVVGDSLFYLPNIPTFVHSLQNLCFALTGKELEIK